MPGSVNSPADLNSVISVFGPLGPSPAPRDLSAYYRGGPYVPSGPGTASIPTTAPIILSHFAGAYYTTGTTFPYSVVYNVAGSGSVTIPNCSTGTIIEIWGGGGGGGGGAIPACTCGGGGGSGSFLYNRFTWGSCAWGKTIDYIVGCGGGAGIPGNNGALGQTSIVSSGTYNIPTVMDAPGGHGGHDGTFSGGAPGGAGGSAGIGGTATAGNPGSPGISGLFGDGGAGITTCITSVTGPYGCGGNGYSGGPSQPGTPGAVAFTWE